MFFFQPKPEIINFGLKTQESKLVFPVNLTILYPSASQPSGRGVTFLNKTWFVRHPNLNFESLAVTFF
jgi:hypothetical protein